MLISWCHSPNPYRKSSTVASEVNTQTSQHAERKTCADVGWAWFSSATSYDIFCSLDTRMCVLWAEQATSGPLTVEFPLSRVLKFFLLFPWRCQLTHHTHDGTGLFTCLRWTHRASIGEVCRLGGVDRYSPCAPTELCLVQDMSWF